MTARRWTTIAIAALLLVPGVLAAEEDRADAWWEAFDDPALSSLIAEGLESSPDLITTRERIDSADAAALQAIAPALPQLSIDLSGRLAAIESLGSSATNQGQDLPDTYETYSAKAVAVLTLDVWGGTILAHRAARREALATRADAARSEQALAARIAEAYYDVVAARMQVGIVTTQIETSSSLLELVQLYYESGDATGLDVLQQRQQLAGTRTLLPAAEAAEQSARQQLAVLIGRPATAQIDVPATTLPAPAEAPALGDSASLVDSRSDVRAARRRLDAAKSQRISAVSGFLPTVQLSGSAGEEWVEITDREEEFVWEVGAGISIPLFSGGQHLGAYKKARAAERIAEQGLRAQTLAAQQEVEGALVAERRYRGQARAYRAQLTAAADALDQSKSRYLAGLADYQSVLTALNTRQQSELNLIDSDLGLVASRVRLHEAVGGVLPSVDFAGKENAE